MRYHSEVARRNYRRVLMAVYWLSEYSGTTCDATDAAIGREAALSAATAKRYVRDLEEDGTIAVFHSCHKREIVLLDHPDARLYLGLFAVDQGMTLSRYSRPVRGVVEALQVSAG